MEGLVFLIELILMLVFFVGIGLIFGIIGWKKKQYAKMYGGFGHFAGVLIGLIVSFIASLDDGISNKGLEIIIYYPFFSIGGWLLGLHFGKEKDKRISNKQV